jgi:eukaryotic-like serine/threonine-protein kinase
MPSKDIIGEVISHYRVMECIGRGGMGVVYRAFDLGLEREVALKMLLPGAISSPGAKKRLKREAKSASAINHPNVAHIYEIGEAGPVCFIAMELVEGETLARRISGRALDETEVLHLAMQIAGALAAAHRKGIVHRDIKPANILVNREKQVKVLDFGLAKVRAIEAEDGLQQTLTGGNIVMGTVEYMSPEQALGHQVDPRSDMFSLGVLLYQMATGSLPFRGKNSTELLARIFTSPPEPIAPLQPGITPDLERIIRKCLEKDPNRRYQSMEELLLDLRPLSGTGASLVSTSRLRKRAIPKRYLAALVCLLLSAALVWFGFALHSRFARASLDSLAVLPLVNKTGDASLDYLSEGISESVISRVSRVRSVTVRPRSAVIRYVGKDVDARAVGKELDVRAVLTGRMLLKDGDLMISAELTDVGNNRELWGDQYKRPAAAVYEIQEEISREVVRSLRLRTTEQDRQLLSRQDTRDREAYQLYLKGRYFWNKRTAEGLAKGIEYFQQAIEKDPNYARAYSGLADSYVFQGNLIRPADIFPKAKAAAMKAIERDENLAEPYATLGYIALHYDWNWSDAETAFKKSFERNLNYPTAHSMYARYLTARGRFREALDQMKRAQELDPLALGISTGIGLCYFYAGQYDRAIDQYRKTLEIDSAFALAHFDLGGALGQKHQLAEAIAEFQAGFQRSPNDAGAIAELGYVHAKAGRTEEAQNMLDTLRALGARRYIAPYFPALIYAGRGDRAQALAYLERGFEDRTSPMVFLNVEPRFGELRSEPRFQNLLRRLQLANDKPAAPVR